MAVTTEASWTAKSVALRSATLVRHARAMRGVFGSPRASTGEPARGADVAAPLIDRRGVDQGVKRVMRNVVGLLLAAAVGIHCSAQPESPEPSSAPELVAAPGRAQTDAPAEPTAGDRDQTAEKVDRTGAPMPEFSPLIPESATTHVTSTVTDAWGASFATGTFEGRIVIGNTALQSRGDKDVFLIKLDREGRLVWVRAVGSGLAESGPRVTLDDGDSVHVHLIGITKGRMDCGSGPLPTWSSDTFFLCIFGGADGAPVSGGVFPTGAP
jgi:hypothetical protein